MELTHDVSDLTEGPVGMLVTRMTSAHMRAVNFARAHGISADIVNAVIARLEASGVPLSAAGDLATNIFRMILTGAIDPVGAIAPAFSESALGERVARTVTMRFRNRRAADDFAEVLDGSPYPYYEDPDEPYITVEYRGDQEREDIEMMAADFGAPILTESPNLDADAKEIVDAAADAGVVPGKRMNGVQARAVVQAWLATMGWGQDYNIRTRKAVWISRDEQQRVTFLRQNLLFEKGGRGNWEKDYDFHEYGREMKTIETAEKLYKNSLRRVQRMGLTESVGESKMRADTRW